MQCRKILNIEIRRKVFFFLNYVAVGGVGGRKAGKWHEINIKKNLIGRECHHFHFEKVSFSQYFFLVSFYRLRPDGL